MEKKTETPKNKKIKKELTTDDIVKYSILGMMAVMVIIAAISILAPKGGKASTMGAMTSSIPGIGAKEAEEDKTVTVSTKTVELEALQNTVKVTGDVTSETETSVYPEVSGTAKVTRILKNEGDYVERRGVIGYVDSSKPGQNFAESPIISPLAGTVISLFVDSGDTISSSTEVALVGSLDDLEIEVTASERYANLLTVGYPAFIQLAVAPNDIFEATISEVSPVVNRNNRTIKATLTFNEIDERIKPGMYANIHLVVQEALDTIVVPKTAIRIVNDEQTVVIVTDNNIAKRVAVTTGISNDSDIQITSGLNVGDVVVTVGSPTDGSTVRIANQ